MSILYLYSTILALLLLVILGIARKTLTMVREGQPLVAVGGLQWQASALRPKPQPSREPAHADGAVKPKPLAGLFARLRPAVREAAQPVAELPPRERSRRIASLSEFRAAEGADRFALAVPTAAEFAAATEPRIEAELDRLCAGIIDLPAFAAFVAAQHVELDRHLAAARDADSRAALEAAGAIIAFSRDWVSQQQ